jgi:hypothetical protein
MIEYSNNFLKEAKKLSKKFKLLKSDLKIAVQEIENSEIGVPLGFDLYKKRVKNSLIPTGKSGGFRIIVYKKIKDNIILISIYSKTQKESLSVDELRLLAKKYFSDKL